jgi:hypothetical protein
MDKDILVKQIIKLKSECNANNSAFVVFYSNAEKIMNAENWDENELLSLIYEQMSSIAISISDELDIISELLEKYLESEIKKDTDDFREIISTLGYKSISFDSFVGDEFFDNDYQNTLLARMLLANSLTQDQFTVDINYYPCGANYRNEKDEKKERKRTKFNSIYTINKEPIII